jgi:hypothetical protein
MGCGQESLSINNQHILSKNSKSVSGNINNEITTFEFLFVFDNGITNILTLNFTGVQDLIAI